MTDPYQAPPPGGHYRRRAAVVIETAPGMFVQYILELELPDDAARVGIDYDEPELDLVDFGMPLRNPGRRRTPPSSCPAGWSAWRRRGGRPGPTRTCTTRPGRSRPRRGNWRPELLKEE